MMKIQGCHCLIKTYISKDRLDFRQDVLPAFTIMSPSVPIVKFHNGVVSPIFGLGTATDLNVRVLVFFNTSRANRESLLFL